MSTTNNSMVASIKNAVNENYDWNSIPVVRFNNEGTAIKVAERIVHGSILRTIFCAEDCVIIDHDGALPEGLFALGGKDAFSVHEKSFGTLVYMGSELEVRENVNYAKLQALLLHGKAEFTFDAKMVVVDTDLTTDGRAWANNAWLQQHGNHLKVVAISTLDRVEFMTGNYAGHKGMVTVCPAPEAVGVDNRTSTPILYVGKDYVKSATKKPEVGSVIDVHVAVIENSPAWESYKVTFGAQSLRFIGILPTAFRKVIEDGFKSSAEYAVELSTIEGLRSFYGRTSLEEMGLEDNQVMSAKVKALVAGLPTPGKWIDDLSGPAIRKTMKEAVRIDGFKSRLYSDPSLNTFVVCVPKALSHLVGSWFFAKRDPMALCELVAVKAVAVSKIDAFEVSQRLTSAYEDGDDDGDHIYFVPTNIDESELMRYNNKVTTRVTEFEEFIASHVGSDSAVRPITPAEAAIRSTQSKRAVGMADGELQGAYELSDAVRREAVLAGRFLIRRSIDSAKHIEFDVPAHNPKAPRQNSMYRFIGGKVSEYESTYKSIEVIVDGLTYRDGNPRKVANAAIAQVYDSIREPIMTIKKNLLQHIADDAVKFPVWTNDQAAKLRARMAQSQDYMNAVADEEAITVIAKYHQYVEMFRQVYAERDQLRKDAIREAAMELLREIRGMKLSRNTKMVMVGLSLGRSFAGIKGIKSLNLIYGCFAIAELNWLSAQIAR